MSIHKDVRYGLRMIGRNPALMAAAILCLALGIGATTAIFSVVNAVVLRPLPYRNAGKLVRIYSEFPTFPNGGLRRFWISPPEYLDLKREATRTWELIGAWTTGGANLNGARDATRVTATSVTGDLLNSLGIQPVLGRLITPKDDVNGAPGVAVISYGLWQRAFGGDRSAIGRDVRLDAQKCTIIGVMPRGYEFPPGEVDATELWTPLQIDPQNPGGRGSHFLYLLGRLREGATPAQGLDELKTLTAQWGAKASPKTHTFSPKSHPLAAYGFQDEVIRTVRPAMLMLLGAVCFVLLIACVNVANLLLARSETRQREMAIRKAMGAGLGVLARQLAVEGVLLSLTGAALGVAFAWAGLGLIKSASAGTIPRADAIGIDGTVLLFTVVVSVATGISFGLAPLIHLASQNVHEALKSAGNRATTATGANSFRRVLVVAELALALVLLIGTGLMVRAFWKLQEVDAGFTPKGIMTMETSLPNQTYKDSKSTIGFWTTLLERASHIPGVQATVASGLPPVRPINANDTKIEGYVKVPDGPMENVDYYNLVGERYFETMGIHLIEGRFFDERDGESAPRAAIVNQTMAHVFWPHQSPLGRHVRPGGPNTPQYEAVVVGVVADVKNAGLDKPTGTELYFALRQCQVFGTITPMTLILKSKDDPRQLAGVGRREIQSIDASLPVSKVMSMDDVMGLAQSRPRFLTMLLTIFTLVALALAAVGIYGVISYSVAQRTPEFGIRLALGASAKDVRGMVLGQGMVLGLLGVGAGALFSFILARFMTGLLFGVSSYDPVTFITMALALLVVTLVACYIPARRATKVDPMTALRYE
jgi:putative ABC transport system permease protein